MNKGLIQLPVLLVLAVAVLVGAYYVGTTAGKLPSVNISLTPPLPPEVPTLVSPTPSSKPASSPTPTPKTQAVKLTYNLPSGWKIVQDATGTFEIGYDPKTLKPSPRNLALDFSYVAHPGSFGWGINRSYDGGSRHQFIYKQLGYTEPWMVNTSKTKDYYEKEYLYNNWSCLVLYGLTFSASGTTWGMCAINQTQALFYEGLDEKGTEQMIQTIKLLKKL